MPCCLLWFQVTAEELTGNDDYVELSFSARKLDDKVYVHTHTHLQICIKQYPW